MGKSIENLKTVARVGVDLAKNVIQVHCVDAEGEVVTARALRRGAVHPPFSFPSCSGRARRARRAGARRWGR